MHEQIFDVLEPIDQGNSVQCELFLERKNRRWRQNAQLKHDYLLWHMDHMIHCPHLKFSFLKKRRGYQRADRNFAIKHLMRYNKQNDEYLIKRYQGIAKNKFRTYRRYFQNRKHKDRLDFGELIYRNSKKFVEKEQDVRDCSELISAIVQYESINKEETAGGSQQMSEKRESKNVEKPEKEFKNYYHDYLNNLL